MGIKEELYKQQSKILEVSLSCKNKTDAKRFINKHINYLENKEINNIIISLYADFNDKRKEK